MEKSVTAQETKLAELNKTYQEAKQKLEEMEKANDSSSDAVKEQRKRSKSWKKN